VSSQKAMIGVVVDDEHPHAARHCDHHGTSVLKAPTSPAERTFRTLNRRRPRSDRHAASFTGAAFD
jgi:hypothetical protein